MKITVNKDNLLQILTHTQGVVDKRHSMPVLANLLLEASNGELEVIATDLEIGLKQKCEAQVQEEGRASASSRKLFEIVREAGSDEVSIQTMENQWLEVSYGRSNFKLTGMDPAEHPGMPTPPGNGKKVSTMEIDPGDLAGLIHKTIFAVSSDDTRSNLAGVYMIRGEKKGILRTVATDGHRLAMVERKIKGEAPAEGIIMPRKGLSEVAKLLGEETEKVTITVTGNEATFSLSACTFSMRLVEGTFPDYQQVVPKETPNIVGAGRDELLQTIRRVSILSSERARGIRLTLRAGSMHIAANNPDVGEAKEDVGVEYEGDEIEVGFNARYFLDVLAVLPEGSRVEIGLGDELSPGVISGDDPGYRYVVMPMRI